MKKFFKKHYKKVSIMIVTLLLSFTLILLIQPTHAIDVGLTDYNMRDYYLLNSTSSVSDSTFTQTTHVINSRVYYLSDNLYRIEYLINAEAPYMNDFKYVYFKTNISYDPFDSDYNLLFIGLANGTFNDFEDPVTNDVYHFNSDYINGFSKYLYDNDTEYDDVTLLSLGVPRTTLTVTVYVESLQTIPDTKTYIEDYLFRSLYLTTRPALNIMNDSFGNNDYSDGYNQGYDDAQDYYITTVVPNEKSLSYNQARSFFGIFINDQWYSASAYGVLRYNEGFDDGYDDGILITAGEAYDKGFIEGGNASFVGNIHNWIVPAIIIVLFLGGAVTVFMRKRE